MKTEALPYQKLDCLLLDPMCFSPFYDFNLASHLAKRGWHLDWITSQFPFEVLPSSSDVAAKTLFYSSFPVGWLLRREAATSARLLRGALKFVFYPVELLKFTNYLKPIKPGILHIQWANIPWIDRLFWSKWKGSHWKLVYTAHDPLPLTGTTPKVFSFRNDLFSYLDALVVHSERGKEEIISLGCMPEKIHVCKMGPTLTMPMRPLKRDEAVRRLGLPDNKLNILFFGFIKPYKGLDNLLRSLPTVYEALKETCLIVAGKLMEPFSNYRSILESIRPVPQIIWNLNFIPSRDISLYFSAADVVVAPYNDGSSSSVIDLAHHFNKPVVATSVGGLPEQIDTRYGDALVPPRSPALLARALIDVLKKNRQARKGNEAREYSHDSFELQWNSVAAIHDEIYKGLSTLS